MLTQRVLTTAELEPCVQLEEAEEHKQRAAIDKQQYEVQLEAAQAEKHQCLEQAADDTKVKAAAAEQALQEAQAAMAEVHPHHMVPLQCLEHGPLQVVPAR